MSKLEHSILQQLPYLHPNRRGIFRWDFQDRLAMQNGMQYIAQSFGIDSLSQLRRLLQHDGQLQEIPPDAVEAKRRWVESHGLTYDASDHEIKEALGVADEVIEYFSKRLFRHEVAIEPKNEVINEWDPVKLIQYALINPDEQLRFEAARKLYLADLAMTAKRTLAEAQPKMDSFYRILNDKIFSNPFDNSQNPSRFTSLHVLSYHSPDDFSCLTTREIRKGEKIDESLMSPFMRFNTLPMRTWYDNKGNPHLVLIQPRVKNIASFVIKMLRNDTLFPSLDDILGVKLTFLSTHEANLFNRALQSISREVAIGPLQGDIKYTIREDPKVGKTRYKGKKASSKDLEIFKFHLDYQGTTYEIQCNTIRTYIDSQMKNDTAWEEYEYRRTVTPDQKGKPAITDLLFPKLIYKVNLKEQTETVLATNRQTRRQAYSVIPEEFRRKRRLVRFLPEGEIDRYLFMIAEQILEKGKKPDYITVVEDNPHRLYSTAVRLAKLLGLPLESVLEQEKLNNRIKRGEIARSARILLFDDFYIKAKHINLVRRNLQQLGYPMDLINTAVLILDRNKFRETRHSKRVKKAIEELFYADIQNTNRVRFFFPFEVEKPIASESLVYLIARRTTRKRGEIFPSDTESNSPLNDIEILIEYTKDGRIQLPGGKKISRDQSNLPELLREIEEEQGVRIRKSQACRLSKAGEPFLTNCEPHPDLTKPWSPKILHDVWLVDSPTIRKKSPPKEFFWMPLDKVAGNLRWQGQRELWSKLYELGIIDKLEESITSAVAALEDVEAV